jgi:hypothetical protein
MFENKPGKLGFIVELNVILYNPYWELRAPAKYIYKLVSWYFA